MLDTDVCGMIIELSILTAQMSDSFDVHPKHMDVVFISFNDEHN